MLEPYMAANIVQVRSILDASIIADWLMAVLGMLEPYMAANIVQVRSFSDMSA
jgi:hypothetical protein